MSCKSQQPNQNSPCSRFVSGMTIHCIPRLLLIDRGLSLLRKLTTTVNWPTFPWFDRSALSSSAPVVAPILFDVALGANERPVRVSTMILRLALLALRWGSDVPSSAFAAKKRFVYNCNYEHRKLTLSYTCPARVSDSFASKTTLHALHITTLQ